MKIKNKWKIYKDISGSLEIFEKWAIRGLIAGQIKEKYDTTRWYAYFTCELSLHDLIYPRHYFIRFPIWLYKLDCIIFKPFFRYTRISRLFTKWQFYCYSQAYKEVLTKYPDILHAIDHPELIDPKIITVYSQYK